MRLERTDFYCYDGGKMGDYYYFPDDDKSNDFGYLVVPEDEVVEAIMNIAKKEGVTISNKDILRELGFLKKRPRLDNKKIHKISLYVDGTNLFAGQYDLFGPRKIALFGAILNDIRTQYKVGKVFFYASYTPRKPKRRPLIFFASEQLFYHNVRKVKGVIFYKGDRSPTSGKEKGVDVHLALDMVKDAFLSRYDEAVIMSGDADLVYAVKIVRELFHKPVHSIFLPNRFSLGLAYGTLSSRVLNYKKRFGKMEKPLPRSLKIIEIKDPTCKQVG